MLNKKLIFLIFLGLISISFAIFFYSSSQKVEVHSHATAEEVYTCPMHPEIRQNEPGSCPICHMKLVKVETNNNNPEKSGTDLNISPYQADLIGIEPTEVKRKDVVYAIPVSGRMLSNGSVALQVFEKDLRYIKKGVAFSGTTEIYPEKELVGKVTSIDNLADPSSRTIRVVGQIIKGKQNYPSEASFIGNIQVNLGNSLIIPERAVLFSGHGSYVYTYDNNTLQPQKVVLGPKIKEYYVVLEGIDEGTKISSGPNFLIDSESKIRGLDDQKHH